jgi:hypothetical protein
LLLFRTTAFIGAILPHKSNSESKKNGIGLLLISVFSLSLIFHFYVVRRLFGGCEKKAALADGF